MKTINKFPKLAKNIELRSLFVDVAGTMKQTDLIAIYSPTHQEVIGECRKKFIPTTNEEFIEAMQELADEKQITLSDVRSISKGGKIVSKLLLNDNDNQVPKEFKSLLKRFKTSFEVYVVVIETNDTAFKMSMGFELVIGGKSGFFMTDKTLTSSQYSTKPFANRKVELPFIFDETIQFMRGVLLQMVNSFQKERTLTEIEGIIQGIINPNRISSKMYAIESQIHLDYLMYRKTFGDNDFTLLLSLFEYIYSKHDLEEEKNQEIYLIGSLQRKTKEILTKVLV